MARMTALYDAAGQRLTKSQAQALTTPVPDPQLVTVEEDIYADRPYDQTAGRGATDQSVDGSIRQLLYPKGAVIPAAELAAHFPTATVTDIDPDTGPEEGGTEVTITGTNLSGVSAVLFGANAGTDLKIVSQTEITVKTPAGSAGAVNVTVKDDSGDVVKTNGFTYVGG
jgi:hypothetical protein